MQVTLKNGSITLTVDCETYSITPKYTNIWVENFEQVAEILQHRICEAVRVSVLNCNYDIWQVGFKTEDIKIEI